MQAEEKLRNTKAQLRSQVIEVSQNMTGMETDAEARAVLEIIRRNAGPGCFDMENTEVPISRKVFHLIAKLKPHHPFTLLSC